MKRHLLQEMALPCFWLFFFIVFDRNHKPEPVKQQTRELIREKKRPAPIKNESTGDKENGFIKAVYLPVFER